MKIATFNVNSIRVRIDQVIDWLKRESPDLLCLQETKVQDKDFPKEPFIRAGYRVFYKGQKSHAGVAIAMRSEPREVGFGLDDAGGIDAPRLIRIEMDELVVINTYVPQGRSLESEQFQYKLDWLDRFLDLLRRRYRPDTALIWCGDLNVAPEPIDVHDPKRLAQHVDFHPLVRAALDKVRGFGLVDVFRKFHPEKPGQYTFWDYRVPRSLERGLGWRIDHIFATAPLAEKAKNAWIDVEARKAAKPSDHTLLVAEFSL